MPPGTSLHDRLRSVAGDRSYRVLGELTATHPETVRRYMTGQAPSVEFVTAFCRVFRVSHEWVLTGRGPARSKDVRAAMLTEASVSELLNALARSLEQLTERVERLERFVHTMEARLRAGRGAGNDVGGSADGPQTGPAQGITDAGGSARSNGSDRAERGGCDNGGGAEVRVRSVADAVAGRPRAVDG